MIPSSHEDIISEAVSETREGWSEYESYVGWLGEAQKTDAVQSVVKSYYGITENGLYSAEFNGEVQTPLLYAPDSWIHQEAGLDAILGELTPREETKIAPEGLKTIIRQTLHRVCDDVAEIDSVELSNHFWNSILYRPVSVSVSDGIPVFDFELTDYFTFSSRSKQLYYEMFREMYRTGMDVENPDQNSIETVSSRLDFRDEYASSSETLLNFGQHPRVMGSNVVAAFATDSGYVTPIHQRSSELFHFPEYISVTPAGNFQHHTDIQGDFSLERLATREFAEELYGVPEDDDVATSRAVRELEDLRDDGDATFWSTGVGVNLLDSGVIHTGVLVVNDESFLETHPPEATWEMNNLWFEELENLDIFELDGQVTAEGVMALNEAQSVLRQQY